MSARSLPCYAILSHCWGEGEVLFADVQDLSVARQKPGWMKVEKACWSARRIFQCDWLWDDTCCIDKSSSAELSEAINSMYAWYESAEACLAYLHDVEDGSAFDDSRWFTRGWTLQELIAPRTLIFFSKSWNQIGNRQAYARELEQITGIDAGALRNLGWTPADLLSGRSVAERMSWASRRETTRPEDMAYCLLGIFGVNMPPIYGEGEAGAFRRLQLEIIQRTNDRSILAWGHSIPELEPWSSGSPLPSYQSQSLESLDSHRLWAPGRMLSPSPTYFPPTRNKRTKITSDMSRWLSIQPIRELHYTHTNAGLRIQLPLRRTSITIGSPPRHLYYGALGCLFTGDSELKRDEPDGIVALLLVRTMEEPGVYVCVQGCNKVRDGPRRWRGDPYRPGDTPTRVTTIPIREPIRAADWKVSTIYIATNETEDD
ncbi:Vegetative incompatibility protein HET-E-1 [Trametes pubescens]|uniref:Vegetative incompatibility protein HET-E-1 n=1 Tax=Trametes pubescens TaxID=154538 RepID=A0A1M2VZ84_TRAPU|nr:Vegetative incompatibility protein HET-E-1 [Trametes pubescens]